MTQFLYLKNTTTLYIFLIFCTIACQPYKHSRNGKFENYEDFYQRFHQDSLFQISRIHFPLDGYSIEGGQIHSWNATDWVMHKNGLSQVDTSIYQTQRIYRDQKVQERIFQSNGGMLIERQFTLIDQHWWLTFYLYVFL